MKFWRLLGTVVFSRRKKTSRSFIFEMSLLLVVVLVLVLVVLEKFILLLVGRGGEKSKEETDDSVDNTDTVEETGEGWSLVAFELRLSGDAVFVLPRKEKGMTSTSSKMRRYSSCEILWLCKSRSFLANLFR